MQLLLVHGMARTPLSLARLALHLRRAGHDVTVAGYVAALEPFAAIRNRVRAAVERVAASGRPYALVGHSLGGLLLRMAAATPAAIEPGPRHLVMLGTPNRPPRLARRLRRVWPYRLVNGEAGQLLAAPEFFATLPPLTIPYTIVAGTGGRRGRWSPFGDDPNDGTVAVSETLVGARDEPILLPVRHTFMMNHPGVRAAIRAALAED